jgi:hypothetical protein
MRKNWASLVTACSLAFANIGAVPVLAANSSATLTKDSFTYQLPADLKPFVRLSADMVTVQNPHPPELLQKHLYSASSYLEDKSGSVLDDATFHASKMGFLLEVYNFIAILPPLYQEGYEPEQFRKKMSETEPFSLEWGKLRVQRGEKFLQARIQALIQAGYVLPEEIDGGPVTKEFAARVLYRMYKDAVPYKGSVAPLDSADVAVRWAVERGIPGYEMDQQGNVSPQLDLNQSQKGGQQANNTRGYRELFDFLRLYLPGKKTGQGWEYYQLQLKPHASFVCGDCLIRVNGQPLQQLLDSRPDLSKNEAFMANWQKTAQQISAQAAEQFPALLERKRQDTLKPRVLDWTRDVLRNETFSQPIAHYRKTKSAAAAETVYRAVSDRYNLFPRQDSIEVIRSVLDNLK